MYSNSETRSNVFEKWIGLTEFDGLGDHLQFYLETGILSRPSDLYKLSLRHLYQNRGISNEEAHRVLETIENTKELYLARVLLCLLPDADLASIEKVTKYPCTFEELAEKCSPSEYSGELLEELYRLSQLGIELIFGEDPVFKLVGQTPFTDKKIMVAGKLSTSNKVIKERLAGLGATIQESITKDTDFLLLGEGAPEEADLAIKIGIKILTEGDVAVMLGIE